ncbi:hypothetical protein ASO20_02445 [Mycoplasma sp. (ex Biomphalaria glabrata)]|nr:hypothetical protein ASO20_02445 [Mycoplasma sp. (ex Biomphalaria glabrata)]
MKLMNIVNIPQKIFELALKSPLNSSTVNAIENAHNHGMNIIFSHNPTATTLFLFVYIRFPFLCFYLIKMKRIMNFKNYFLII